MSLDPPTMVVGWMLVKCFLSASLPTDLSHHRSLKSASQLLVQHIVDLLCGCFSLCRLLLMFCFNFLPKSTNWRLFSYELDKGETFPSRLIFYTLALKNRN